MPVPANLPAPPTTPLVPPPPWAGESTPTRPGSEGTSSNRGSRLPVVVGVAAALAIVAAVAGGIAVSRHSSSTARDVSFVVPDGWRDFPQATFRAQQGGAPISTRTVGIDYNNGVVIQAYLLTTSVDPGNLAPIQTEIDALLHRLTLAAGGSILSGPVPATLGSLPGFRYQISTYDPKGNPVESRVVFAFSNRTEYFLNCQHTPAHAAEIEAGCDQISQTFRAA
jgi:hypothetical protein